MGDYGFTKQSKQAAKMIQMSNELIVFMEEPETQAIAIKYPGLYVLFFLLKTVSVYESIQIVDDIFNSKNRWMLEFLPGVLTILYSIKKGAEANTLPFVKPSIDFVETMFGYYILLKEDN